jgi:hypothetical protein
MASSLTTLISTVRDLIRRELPPPLPAQTRDHRYASDYLQPTAAFPLVYVTDIANWAEDRATTQVSFMLTHGARYTNDAASFTCRLPFADGDLFEKRGAYLVVIVPATDQEQVDRVRRAARGGR